MSDSCSLICQIDGLLKSYGATAEQILTRFSCVKSSMHSRQFVKITTEEMHIIDLQSLKIFLTPYRVHRLPQQVKWPLIGDVNAAISRLMKAEKQVFLSFISFAYLIIFILCIIHDFIK